MNKQLIIALIVAGGCVASIVVAWILLMICAHRLSFAKAYGQRKRETCGNEYLELETARYEIDQEYSASIGERIKTSRTILYSIFMVPLCVAVVMLGMLFVRIPWGALNQSETKIKRYIYLALASVLVLGTFAANVPFWMAEVQPDVKSKYLTKQNRPFMTSSTMGRTKVTVVAVSIVIALWVAVLAYKYVLREDGAVDLGDYQQAALAFSVIALGSAAMIIAINDDRDMLEQNITADYGTIKSELQKNALALKYHPEFVKYLQINIKRVNPELEGNPDLSDATFADNLYAYLEHRPGVDKYDIQSKYFQTEKVKATFQPFLAGATSATDRQAILDLLLRMYATNLDDNYVFRKSDLYDWLTTSNLMTELLSTTNRDKIAQGIKTNIDAATASNTNNTGITLAALRTALQSYQENPHDLSSATQDLVDIIEKGILNLLGKKPNIPISRIVSFNSNDQKVVPKMLSWFVYFSTYKHETAISLEEVLAMIDQDTTINREVRANLKQAFNTLDQTSEMKTGIEALQTSMRSARAVETEVVGAVDLFLKHVTWLSVGVIAVGVYAVMHYLYEYYRSETVIGVGMFLLLGVFGVTWYAWFFAKLKLSS